MTLVTKDFDAMVGARIKQAREDRDVTQQELAEFLGFNDRQTLSHIESGKRKVTSDELSRLMERLGKDLDYFTDPYLIVGKASFNWRARVKRDSEADVESAESRAKPIISAYKRFRGHLNEPLYPFTLKLNVTRQNSYEDAARLGEQVAHVMELGSTPACNLASLMEKKFHILTLYMDLPDSVSGGACKLDDLSTIIVNRSHNPQRQAFTLAHELFHLLTWDAMKPEHTESANYTLREKAPKEEKLADNFAAGLLMPTHSLKPRWDLKNDDTALTEWLRKVSGEYNVSALALYYRLLNLGWITRTEAKSVSTEQLNGVEDLRAKLPAPLLSAAFVDLLRRVLSEGYVSARKAADLLHMTIDEMRDLFADHKMAAPFDL